MVNKIAKISFYSILIIFSLIGIFLIGIVLAGEGYEIDWGNFYFNFSDGSNMTFVGGDFNLTGNANITGFVNWTIVLYQNESDIVNESLCSGEYPVNDTNSFCLWDTLAYCSTECTNYSLVLFVTNDSTYNGTIYNITIDNLSPDVGNISIDDSDPYVVNASVNITDGYLSWVNAYLFNSSYDGDEIVGGDLYNAWYFLFNSTQSEESFPSSGEFEVSWDKKRYSINDTLVSAYFMNFCEEDYIFVPGCFDETGTQDYNCTNWWMVFNSTAIENDYEFLGIWNFLDWLDTEEDACTVNTSLIFNDSVFLVQLDYFNSSGDDMDFDERWTYTNATNISLYNISEAPELNLNLTSESVISGNPSFMLVAWDFVNMGNGNGLESFEVSSGLDVDVSKTLLNTGNVVFGDVVQYLINITNTGEVNITNISLVDNWDVSLNYTTSDLTGNETDYEENTTLWENILTEELEVGNSTLIYVNFSAIGYALQVSNWVSVNVSGNEDTLNNVTASETIRISTIPFIDFSPDSEEDVANLTRDWIYVNVTIEEVDVFSNITFYLYNGSGVLVDNETSEDNETTSHNFTGLSVGNYSYNVTVYNDAGNSNSTEIRTANIVLLIDYPEDGGFYNEISEINYSIMDSIIDDSCWFSFDEGVTNSTVGNATNLTFTEFNGTLSIEDLLVEDINNLTVFCNNSDTEFNTIASFTYDITAPIITLISPANLTSSTTDAYNFTFNVTDSNEIESCVLIFNNAIVNTLTTGINNSGGTNGMYNSSLAVGVYNWSINCTDVAENTNFSLVRRLVVEEVPEDSSPSSSGGDMRYYPSLENLNEGYTRNLGKNYKIYFIISGTRHLLNIDSITSSGVTITISSTPQTKTLSIGEEWKIELTGDNYYDLSVKLNSITRSMASLTIKNINEEIKSIDDTYKEDQETGDKKEGTPDISSFKSVFWTWFIIILIVIIVVLVLFFIKKKRKKRRGHYFPL